MPQFILAQNLVPNASFEEYVNCPDTTHHGSWYTPSGTQHNYDSSGYYCWVNTVKYWKNANTISPRYYNCGYYRSHKPRTGMGCISMGGIVNIPQIPPVNKANYIATFTEIELTENLLAGKEYCVNMYVLNTYRSSIAAFGFYFSQEELHADNGIAFTVKPQVENSDLNMLTDTTWTFVGGTFIAQGGERYLTIGVFNHSPRIRIQMPGEEARIFRTNARVKDYTQMSFSYLMDDVSVILLDENTSCVDTGRMKGE
ncbi:MAG: hypothetical protein IIA45_06405 [Bacteroidetes bacterium]|nr:hypothetical protein [Bacteroidota bacterium]